MSWSKHVLDMQWLNSQVKDIESKLRQRSFLHSSSDRPSNPSPEVRPAASATSHPPFALSRTKSSSSVHQPSQPQPNPLLKSKSSTYICPDQNESLMYNTKVTLTLRRSNSHLNSSHQNGLNEYNESSRPPHQNGIKNGGTQNCFYFGANPSSSQSNPHAAADSISPPLPKPPLPPANSKPIILQKTVNIFY